jgi:membrane protein YqaA with SNARE-associated domain
MITALFEYVFIAQSGALPGKAQDYAIGAFIGLHGQKRTFKKTRIW